MYEQVIYIYYIKYEQCNLNLCNLNNVIKLILILLNI